MYRLQSKVGLEVIQFIGYVHIILTETFFLHCTFKALTFLYLRN